MAKADGRSNAFGTEETEIKKIIAAAITLTLIGGSAASARNYRGGDEITRQNKNLEQTP